MSEYETVFSVKQMAKVMGVQRSGYYVHQAPSQRSEENAELLESIHRVFKEHKSNYGSPRVTRQLRDEGWSCGENRIARLMRDAGLQGHTPKRRGPRTTDSRHGGPISPNRLKGREIRGLDEVWVMDITYIQVETGWVYLAAVLDIYSRKIVGWQVAESMTAELVISALKRALATRDAQPGLIVHSDRGSQYASAAFRAVVEAHQLLQSMSAKGNCYDNAAMESFFGTLKREEIDRIELVSLHAARSILFEYIETYYNRRRIHTSIGGVAPDIFERKQCDESGFFKAEDAPAGRRKRAEESLPQPRPSVTSSGYSSESCFPAELSSASQDNAEKAHAASGIKKRISNQETTNPSGV